MRGFWLLALLATVALVGVWGCARVRTVQQNFMGWARSPEGREVLKPLATAGAGMATAEARQTAVAPTVQAQSTAFVATARAQGTTIAATSTAAALARAAAPSPTPSPRPTG